MPAYVFKAIKNGANRNPGRPMRTEAEIQAAAKRKKAWKQSRKKRTAAKWAKIDAAKQKHKETWQKIKAESSRVMHREG